MHVLILGGAIGGLAFDKFILRAEAGTGDAVLDDADVASVVDPNQPTSAPVDREPLGDRFRQADQRLSLPAFRRLDAFSEPAEEVVVQLESENPVARDTGFASRHRLTAVLSQESGDIAVVDGRLLKVGDTVEGVELVRIEPNGAIFEIGDQQIRLPLDRPGFDR